MQRWRRDSGHGGLLRINCKNARGTRCTRVPRDPCAGVPTIPVALMSSLPLTSRYNLLVHGKHELRIEEPEKVALVTNQPSLVSRIALEVEAADRATCAPFAPRTPGRLGTSRDKGGLLQHRHRFFFEPRTQPRASRSHSGLARTRCVRPNPQIFKIQRVRRFGGGARSSSEAARGQGNERRTGFTTGPTPWRIVGGSK